MKDKKKKKKDQICYRCWMSKKDMKKDYCWCGWRGKYYGRHLWKIDWKVLFDDLTLWKT